MGNALGIDVSHHEGNIDWKAVRAAGCNFSSKQLAHGIQLILRLHLDVEISDQDSASLALSDAEWTNRTATCLLEIKRLSGRVPIIYLTAWGADVWKSKIARTTAPDWASNYLLWVSSYPAAKPEILKGWSAWTFWQYDTHGSVNGIAGHVDLDQFNGTPEDLSQWFTPAPASS